MDARSRRLALLLGFLLIGLSLAALAYAYWPLTAMEDQVQLAPTFFAPPP